MVSAPFSTRKKSSVSGWECQTNSPFTFTTMTSWPLNWLTILGDQWSENSASLSARRTGAVMPQTLSGEQTREQLRTFGVGYAVDACRTEMALERRDHHLGKHVHRWRHAVAEA